MAGRFFASVPPGKPQKYVYVHSKHVESFKKMYQRSGDLIYWGSIVGYINHIISFNPLKCLVERASLSLFGKEYTENCSAIATRLESRQAENRIHLFGLKTYLLFQLYHTVFYGIFEGWY